MSRLMLLSILLTSCAPGGGACPSCTTDAGSLGDASASTALVALRIEPAERTLELADASSVTESFMAIGVRADGSEVPGVQVDWSVAPSALGSIDPGTGVLSVRGDVGGVATVRASLERASGDLHATASVTVVVRRRLFAGTTEADAAAFPAEPAPPDPRGARIAYPLDGAVMPQNVLPPELQWWQSEPGEVLRVRLDKPHVHVEIFVRHDERRSLAIDPEAWRVLAASEPDAEIAIHVDRALLDRTAGGALGTEPVRVRLARGALPGSAYYWGIREGRILRIDDDRAVARDVLPHPPEVEGERCVGCHSISPSGRWMAASLGSGGANGNRVGAVFDLTAALDVDPAPTMFPTPRAYAGDALWSQAAWSPDETRLIAERDQALVLVDPFRGWLVRPQGSALPSGGIVQPDWSPDGRFIAYVRSNGWTVDFLEGDVTLLEVTGPDTFGETRTLHRGADLVNAIESGRADSYPSFSPDSRLVAFAHGTGSYSATSSGALYVVPVEGGAPVRLDRASGIAGRDSFAPRFAPFESGGYYWLAFHSHRAYGNPWAGRASDEEGRTRTHGLWITAVRAGAAPGEDPSEVPYWLPGQDVASSNIAVSFTRRACRANTESCSLGSECCSGECGLDASGARVCSPPRDRCRDFGETCDADADCCGSRICFEHVCVDDLR